MCCGRIDATDRARPAAELSGVDSMAAAATGESGLRMVAATLLSDLDDEERTRTAMWHSGPEVSVP
jgi:hypothetical protein